jgi:hypothetical protein
MKLTQSQIENLDTVEKEYAKTIVDAYKDATISNVQYLSRLQQCYAVIKNDSGAIIFSSTLAYCSEQLMQVSYFREKFKF